MLGQFVRLQLASPKRKLLFSTFLFLFCSTQVANASLSGLPEGYPRFSTVGEISYDYQRGGLSSFKFSNWGDVLWQTSPNLSSIELVNDAHYEVDINLDVSSRDNVAVLDGSKIEVWGGIDSLGLTSSTLLFTADVSNIFWKANSFLGLDEIEFVMSGKTMEGAVCDLGFCSYANEWLDFITFSFKGDWRKDFSGTGISVATVPLPAAFWMFGSSFLSFIAMSRRKLQG